LSGHSRAYSETAAVSFHASHLRAFRRAVLLSSLMAFCFARSCLQRMRGPDTLERRAMWLHESAVFVLRHMGIPLRITGHPPAGGLLVSNHLSHLDIFTFAAALPCYLVSKIQIGRWPLFGSLARAGGTIFVDRSSRASAEAVTDEIAERLKGPVPVLFFPEGASTDGSHLLPFHSRFYTPAVEMGVPITAIAVRYVPEHGVPEREFCWVGDEAFLTHAWKVLRGPDFSVEVRFGKPRIYTDRREAADATYAEIERMRSDVNAGVYK
jgi:1-acyl-sn-glycerol-3-phosphate acyltransferase